MLKLLFAFLFILNAFCAAMSDAKVSLHTETAQNYIAVLDLEITGTVDKTISRPLSDSVRHEIVKSGKYEVIDRVHMDAILKEQTFQMTGSVAQDRVVEAGQLLGVGRIIVGSVSVVGKTYYVSLSQVNVITGKSETVEEDSCRGEIDELLEATKRVARKLVAASDVSATATNGGQHPGVHESALAAGNSAYRDPVTGMEFVLVKGGCFGMGDTFGDGDTDELPVHEVCVDDFYLGRYEVTEGQWKAVLGDTPSHFGAGNQHPAAQVSWDAAQAFIHKLNQKAGGRYRLPTEAEWEYAARSGGKKEKWAGTNQESELAVYGWYGNNAAGQSHAVGRKKPNALGLYDMTGNVWEWVDDRYGEKFYAESPRNNPRGPDMGKNRVLRGGSWNDDQRVARTSCRVRFAPSHGNAYDGFRLALPVR
jgi:formylglycine-generating enzyme required for sulfatase activity